MKKVVIFARVSSTNGTQDYERQINDLQVLASANNCICRKGIWSKKEHRTHRANEHDRLYQLT